ncbi:hypothetical protein EZ428_05270 [Pedobacter frigiditerrae]|uniref:Uncharacterized protein n=1 Tax=Pedobacter frigiditerrae TaxID=2530452 RepID=A0A4R0N349_9SPHI|nr:DUF6520 family protein [Pedobacter frigiditerrae]TCC94190.1 hypothetical protein EZ428_05270 [Pedobacter frigiditerrae]
MKNLKKLLPVIAVVLGLVIAFGTSAFKAKVKTPVVYEYTSNSHLAADIKNIANWEVADLETPSCGESGDLVCRFSFEGDMTDLQNYLEDTATDVADINDNAINKKQ